MVTNASTVNEEAKAAETLKLKNAEKTADLKALL